MYLLSAVYLLLLQVAKSKSEVGPQKNWPGAAASYSLELKALKLSYVQKRQSYPSDRKVYNFS